MILGFGLFVAIAILTFKRDGGSGPAYVIGTLAIVAAVYHRLQNDGESDIYVTLTFGMALLGIALIRDLVA